MSTETIGPDDNELFTLEPFSQIAEKDKDFTRRMVERRVYEKGEIIYPQGDAVNGVFFILSGKVKVFHTDAWGRESIVYIDGPGGVFGLAPLLTNERFYVTTAAMDRTTTYFIQTSNITQLIERSPEFAHALMGHLAENIHNMAISIHSAHGSVPERVASSLLRFARLYTALAPKNQQVSFPLRRADLAKISGTTVESAVRSLTRFKEQGVIAVAGRDIRILKPEALMEFTGDYP